MSYKSKIDINAYNAQKRTLYHDRKDNGLCPRCGKPSKGGRVFCKTCRKYDRDLRNPDKRNKAARIAYQLRKAKKEIKK